MNEFLTQAELTELRKTMPWTERYVNTGRQTLVQVFDNRGTEVQLLTILKFCRTLSNSLAVQPEGAAHAA